MIKGGHYCPPLILFLPIKFLHHHCILFCCHLNVFQEIGFRCVSKMVSIYGVHNLIVNMLIRTVEFCRACNGRLGAILITPCLSMT